MARKQYEQFCLRFSLDNPEHVKVLRIFKNLDRELYHSKTQFVMEALESYVRELSTGKKETEPQDPMKEYATLEDLEEMKKKLREEIRTELYQELIVHMADTMMAAMMRQPAVAPSQIQETAQGSLQDGVEKEQEVSEEMMDNVMKWA